MQRYLKNGRNREIKKDKHKREASEASILHDVLYEDIVGVKEQKETKEAPVHEEATHRGDNEEIQK